MRYSLDKTYDAGKNMCLLFSTCME